MSRSQKASAWVLGTLFAMSFFLCLGQTWVIEVPVVLLTGWLSFLQHVGPEVTFRWGAIAETVGVGVLLGVGTHLFLRRLWRQLRAGDADARPWPLRWSVSLVAFLVLLFSATMATVGMGHHVGWLVSRRESALELSWRFSRLRQTHEYEAMCRNALSLSHSGLADAQVTQALLEDAWMRRQFEQLHLVPVRGTDGAAGFLVFPRDPITRELLGGMRCGAGLKEGESFQAAELPRLLAAQRVSEGTAP